MKIKLILAFVLLILNKAYSQIVYTSVTPNFELNMSPPASIDNVFPIDFNNDGVVDFRFRWDAASSLDYFLHITNGYAGVYYPNNHIIGSTIDSFGYVTPLDYGTSIDVSSEWYTIIGPSISNGFNGKMSQAMQNANFLLPSNQ